MKISERFARLNDAENWHQQPKRDRDIPRAQPALRPLAVITAAGVCAISLVTGLSFLVWSGHTKGTDTATPRAVGWRAIPAGEGSIRLTSSHSAPPACQASHLRVHSNGGGGAGGTFYLPVSVVNAGTSDCTVSDKNIALRWAAGRSTVSQGGSRILLFGGSQLYRLAFPTSCTKPGFVQRGQRMHATLSGATITDGTLTLPSVVSSCATATATAVVAPDAQDANTSPYAGLRVSIGVPPQIAAGSLLSYTVTLTNTGPSPFVFATCPTYSEMLGSVTGQISQAAYTLNCSDGGPIGVGGTRTYAMQIRVPTGQGLAKIAWFMDNGPSQDATTTIQ